MLRNILLALCIWFTVDVNSRTIYAEPADAAKLNTIVASTLPYDTLIISSGTYNVNYITITHPLTIIGENFPVLDGREKGEVLSVKSNHVIVRGLYIRNTGHSNLEDYAGIKLYNAAHCIIANNKLENTYFGIYLANTDSCEVSNNELIGNATDEISAGNGIHLWKCKYITVKGNTIDRHRDGIYFEFVADSKIQKNTSTHNVRYGLHFMFSDRDRYEENTFENNGAGVAVMYSKGILMQRNYFSNNWGPTAYGLLLKDISHSEIRNNTFDKNTVGIYMEGSSHLKLNSNDFDNNGWALKIMANCTEDTIVKNNFSGNSFDISTNGQTNENVYELNYWDNYDGYDLDHNGVGDVPYRPVSLFSLVVEEIPCSVMLLRSFMVEILDQAEKTVPVFIPESIIDNKPAMTRYHAGASGNM